MLKRKPDKREGDRNGFEKWGGYMNAKISKLEAQFNAEEQAALQKDERISEIFKGVSIFVNGYTEPSADELRYLMLQHGGVYHHYYRSEKTTHIIASALPNAKFNQMKNLKVVKSEWITESIKAGRLLDYKNYLLQNDFPSLSKTNKENLLTKFLNKDPSSSKKDAELPKTAVDDGYLTEFYKNSRLHYISSLGAMLKQYVQEMRENHNGVFPGKEKLIESSRDITELEVEQENFIDECVIMHIDMDCFFVSVALRNFPNLKGHPVAVTHAKGNSTSNRRDVDRKFEVAFYRKKMKSKINSKEKNSSESDDDGLEEWCNEAGSMSEIASCSYEARKAGVRKGMYLGAALKLCPNLKTVPYDFEGYKEVSMILYDTVAKYTLEIEAISCDELFIDCTNLISEFKINPLKFAETLRQEIQEKTKCSSSVGIGSNKLQARLATKHAKPNGQFYLTPDGVEDFMKTLDVYDLPGVGRTIGSKLKVLNIKTCQDLQKLPLNTLKKEFGSKTGETLYKNCRGMDDRKMNFSHERKSVSAEVNYGIRFNDDEEAETFLKQLAGEVSKRLQDIKMIGKNITFKVMIRAKDAPVETAKFLGHGACDQITRSIGLPTASSDSAIISRHVIDLYHQLALPANDLRGIGIQITKLEYAKKSAKTLQAYFESGQKRKLNDASSEQKLEGMLLEQNKKLKVMPSHEPKPKDLPTKENKKLNQVQPIQSKKTKQAAGIEQPKRTSNVLLPPASQIDPEVLASLPEDICQEIMREYGLSENNDIFNTKKIHNSEKSSKPNRKDTQNFLNLRLNDMRAMIKEWVAAEHHPKTCDVNMLKSYLSSTVEEKNLEKIAILLKCLRRHVTNQQKNNEIWKCTYNDILDEVQVSMLKNYEKILDMEKIS